MAGLLISDNIRSDVISVGSDDIFQLNNSIVGIIYTSVSSGFFSKKIKRRYFQLTDTYLDIWNPKKSHKTCKRINNLKKYICIEKGYSDIFTEKYIYVKISRKNSFRIFYSLNEKGMILFYDKLDRIINKL